MTEDLTPPPGVNPLVFRMLLWKRYFEIGSMVTGYVKYLIALFGLASRDVWWTMGFGVCYGVLTLVVGRAWHHRGYMKLEMVLYNRFNDLADEIRAWKNGPS